MCDTERNLKPTKSNFRELIAQAYYNEYGKTYSQIRIEQTLGGKEPIDIKLEHFKKIEFTAWIFGFIKRNECDEPLVKMFVHGFKRNWFFHDIDNEEYQYILQSFVMDVLGNYELFINLADHIVTKYKPSNVGKELVKVLYATGYTRLDLGEIVKIKNRYDSISFS